MALIKKHILFIISIMAIAITLVTILAWIAVKPSYEKNNFTRSFSLGSLKKVDVVRKDEDVIDISGNTNHSVYFKTHEPGRLWVTNFQLQNGHYTKVAIPTNKNLSGFFYCYVDSPKVNILAGNIPAVIECQQGAFPKMYKFPSSYFTRAVVIGPDSYIFRGLDTSVKTADQIFIKGNPKTGVLIKENNISELRHDAGISTDGFLCYDSTTHLLTYVYFNRNQFLCLDTNLNLIYQAYTIDTLNTYRTNVQVVNFASRKKIMTNVAPDRSVNSQSCTDGGKLYNISDLKADNETYEEFASNTAIDVYDIKSGKYKGSFYIPRYNYEKLISYKVIKDVVIVIYSHYIVSYTLKSFS